MGRTLLTILLLGTTVLALGLIRLRDPAATRTASHAPLPFDSSLALWIAEGVPIAAVADVEGDEYLILVGSGEDGEWSAAVSLGDPPRIEPPIAPVGLGPDRR